MYGLWNIRRPECEGSCLIDPTRQEGNSFKFVFELFDKLQEESIGKDSGVRIVSVIDIVWIFHESFHTPTFDHYFNSNN